LSPAPRRRASASVSGAATVRRRPGRATTGRIGCPDDDDEDEDEELDIEARMMTRKISSSLRQGGAGALATIWASSSRARQLQEDPDIRAIGIVVETLFNVIMPLSLKFLIDDALGEEEFRGALQDPRCWLPPVSSLDRRGLVRALTQGSRQR